MRFFPFITLIGFLLQLTSCGDSNGDFKPNPKSVMTDVRDGKTYSIVKIGNQWWMAENLNIGYYIQSSSEPSDNARYEKYAYGNDTTLFHTYGGLYTWDEAMQYAGVESARGICPDGWHLPSVKEWEDLLQLYPRCPELRVNGSSGFECLMAGAKTSMSFSGMGEFSGFWTSTEYSSNISYYYFVNESRSEVLKNMEMKTTGLSVRCVSDSIVP